MMPSRMKWLLPMLSLFVFAAGCPKGPEVAVTDPLEDTLAGIEEAWAFRGEVGNGIVEQLLDDALRRFPNEPKVHWRRSRLYVSEGMAAATPTEAARHYSKARAAALVCLDEDGRFQQKRRESGWAVALTMLEPEREVCVGWAAWSWVRWMAAHGRTASSLDLERIDALVAQTEGKRLEGGPTTLWLTGLLAAVRSDDKHDYDKAVVDLGKAVDITKQPLVIHSDIVFEIALPTADGALLGGQLKASSSLTADTPEDRRAIERMAVLRN